MKHQILRAVVLFIMITSCSSSDDSSENIEQPIPTSETIQFIELLNKENPTFERGNQFFYQDDNLTYIYLDDCSGQLFHFEYNSSNKISRRYSGFISLVGDTFNPDTFDLDSFKQDNRTSILNFIYEGDRLTQMQNEDNFVRYDFQYDSNGNLTRAEEFLPFINGVWNRVTITYTGNTINTLNKVEYTTNGAVQSDNDYTFEFDDNPNPFYSLNQNEGLLSLFTCTGYDFISSMDGGYKIFKNNATEIRRNGELLFSANYQYDENGYPIRISYNNLNGNVSSNDVITYVEE